MILQPIVQKLKADIPDAFFYYGDFIEPTSTSLDIPTIFVANAEINAQPNEIIGQATRQLIEVSVRVASVGAQVEYVETLDAPEPYAELHASILSSLIGFTFDYNGERIHTAMQHVLAEPILSNNLYVAYSDTFTYAYYHQNPSA